MYRPPDWAQPLLVPLGAALTLAVFLFDLSVPLGVAVGALYVVPLLLFCWSHHRYAPLIFAVASSILIGLGAVYSPPGPVPTTYAIFNRSSAAGLVWVLAVALTRRR